MNTWNLPFSSLKNPKVDSLKCHSDSVATWIFTVTQESQSNKNALSSRQGKLTKVIERRFHECKGTFGDLLFQGRGESWICIALDTRLPWVIMYLLFKLAKYNFVQKKSFILLTLVLKIAVLKVKNIPLWDIIIVWDEKYSSNVTKTAVFSTTAFHYQLFACSNLFTRKHENIHMQLLNN